MYKKYLIIASKQDKAGTNITTQLSQFRVNPIVSSIKQDTASFDFYLVNDEIIYTEKLDMEKINKYDFVIFVSRHKSEKGGKTLSIHPPGNWRNAEFGGIPEKVCKSSALLQKQLFEKLHENAKKYGLKEYEITLEATHHGPLIDKPCVFVEVGSTETEWADRKAGFVLATSINEIIKEFKKNPYREVAIGIGGPHYCPNFNKIQLDSNIAISHVIPQYVFPFTEEMIREAIEKTDDEIDFVILDWKGLGTSEQRADILKILDRNYIGYKKVGDVDKGLHSLNV